MTWQEVVFGVFGLGVLRLAWEARVWWIKRQDTDDAERKKFENVMTSVTRVYDILNELIRFDGIQRGMILKLTNGGGVPKVGSHLKLSILYETSSMESYRTIKNQVQDYIIDEPTIRVMQRVVTDYTVLCETPNIKYGFLRDQADELQSKAVKLSYLAADSTCMVFLMVDLTSSKIAEHGTLANTLNLLTNEMKQIFKTLPL